MSRRGGCDARRRRELRDRDVVGMAVAAVGRKRQDHVRPHAEDVAHDGRDRFGRFGAIEILVPIGEHAEVGNAERLAGRAELGLANFSERVRPGMFRRSERMRDVAPAIAAGRADNRRLHTFARVSREHSAEPQRLVVGMRRDHHQPQGTGHAVHYSGGPCAPASPRQVIPDLAGPMASTGHI